MIVKHIYIFLFIILAQHTLAQNYAVTSFGEEDGLVQNAIYCIAQDEKGRLWLSTDQGLYQYDGSKFKHFGSNEGMSDNEVFAILGKTSDFLLMINFIGKINYYSKGIIFNETNDDCLSEIQLNDTPQGFQLSDSKYILYGRNMKLFYILEEEDGRLINVQTVYLEDSKDISHLEFTKNKIIVSYTENGIDHSILEYDTTGIFIGRHEKHYFNTKWPISRVENIEFNEHSFIVTSKIDGNEIFTASLKTDNYSGFKIGNDYWIRSRNGIKVFSKDSPTKTFFENIPINFAFEDMDKNIWIGTEGFGLKLLQESNISRLTNKQNEAIEFANSIEFLDDQLIIGHNNLSYSVLEKNGTLRTKELVKNGRKINNKIRDIEVLDNKTMYFGTDYRLFQLDKNLNIENIHNDSPAVKCLLNIDSLLYVGSSGDLLKYNLKNETKTNIISNRTISITADNSGNIWFGGNSGLTKYNHSTKELAFVPEIISERRINEMQWIEDVLYLATDSGIYKLENGRTECIANSGTGLPDNNCQRLKVHKNYIWIATARGLAKMHINDNEDLEVYTINDGLESNNINDILIHNDTIYIASSKGINIMNVNAKKLKESYKVNILEAYNNDTIFNVNFPIVLKPGSKTLNIYFAAVSKGNKCSYKYRLNSLSDEWEEVSENNVLFTDLKPGTFKFEVKAISPEGLESDESKIIDITVKPFFYQTNWFYCIIFITIIFLLYSLFKRYQNNLINRERKKNEIQKQHAQLELEAIKAQINPHFIYNALNSIQYSILKGANQNAEMQLASFSKLVRQTLDYSQKNFITLDQEISYLTRYLDLEKLRFKEHLEFEIKFRIQNLEQIKIPSLLIQPFVENAIKHGLSKKDIQSSKINVLFLIKGERLICKIEDSGIGIDSNICYKESPSGLKLSNKRAKTYNTIYNLDITIQIIDKSVLDNNSHGTLVFISIPKNI